MLMIHCALEENTSTLPLLFAGNHVKRDSSETVFSFRLEIQSWRAAGASGLRRLLFLQKIRGNFLWFMRSVRLLLARKYRVVALSEWLALKV
jgi:hypothetical protein